jgi:bacteriorhodopsin
MRHGVAWLIITPILVGASALGLYACTSKQDLIVKVVALVTIGACVAFGIIAVKQTVGE